MKQLILVLGVASTALLIQRSVDLVGLTGEDGLDLLQRLALGLRHKDQDKHDAEDADASIEPEDALVCHSILWVRQ